MKVTLAQAEQAVRYLEAQEKLADDIGKLLDEVWHANQNGRRAACPTLEEIVLAAASKIILEGRK